MESRPLHLLLHRQVRHMRCVVPGAVIDGVAHHSHDLDPAADERSAKPEALPNRRTLSEKVTGHGLIDDRDRRRVPPILPGEAAPLDPALRTITPLAGLKASRPANDSHFSRSSR